MSSITCRDFARNLIGGAAAVSLARGRAATPESATPRRPNILFLFSDQHAHSYADFAGHPVVSTPNINRIAARGVTFRNAYCNNAVCTPARSALAIGMYPSDCNFFCNSTVWDGSHPNWVTRLRSVGYLCFASGRMDLNPAFDSGFDEIATAHAHAHHPDITAFFRRPLCMRIDVCSQIDGRSRPGPATDAAFVNHTLDFIQRQRPGGQPWAVHCGLNFPHPPFIAWQRLLEQ